MLLPCNCFVCIVLDLQSTSYCRLSSSAYCILSTVLLHDVFHSVAYCILSTTLLSAERLASAGSYAEHAEGQGEEE